MWLFFSPVMLGVKHLIAHHWLGPSALVWTALSCKFNNIPAWFKPGYCTLTCKTHFRYNHLQNHSMSAVQVMHSSLVFTFQETLSPFTCWVCDLSEDGSCRPFLPCHRICHQVVTKWIWKEERKTSKEERQKGWKTLTKDGIHLETERSQIQGPI